MTHKENDYPPKIQNAGSPSCTPGVKRAGMGHWTPGNLCVLPFTSPRPSGMFNEPLGRSLNGARGSEMSTKSLKSP